MIPTYNCAQYLRQALESVLAEDLGPDNMQIEVVDDHSTRDDPEAVVSEIGEGQIQFFRHAINRGSVHNFNTCLDRSRGLLVHILHGDDYVLPGFYKAFGNAFNMNPSLALVACRCFVVDLNGEIDYLSPRVHNWESPTNDPRSLMAENPLRTPGVVVRRSFYEKFGGFCTDLPRFADWEMWNRVVRLQSGIFLNSPLAAYRMSPENLTDRDAQTGALLRDYIRLADIWEIEGHTQEATQLRHTVPCSALAEAARFRTAGNDSAADANLRLFREYAHFLPPLTRAKRVIRNVLKRFSLS
jgi:glycosyltransferase involved in cell wall biosynthesis